jgi:hypothetical protein
MSFKRPHSSSSLSDETEAGPLAISPDGCTSDDKNPDIDILGQKTNSDEDSAGFSVKEEPGEAAVVIKKENEDQYEWADNDEPDGQQVTKLYKLFFLNHLR